MDCIFCRIIRGEVPSQLLHRDDQAIVIRDINPQAPTHLLIMPIQHLGAITDITSENVSIMGHMVLVAKEMAQKEGVAKKGYRLAVNCGKEGGQTVPHLHMHLLGGRALTGRLG